jgi:hypothetical protein
MESLFASEDGEEGNPFFTFLANVIIVLTLVEMLAVINAL